MAPLVPRGISLPGPAEQLLFRTQYVIDGVAFNRAQELDSATATPAPAEPEDLHAAEREKILQIDDAMLVEVPWVTDTDVELPTLGDLPRADDVIQAIKDWLSHLFGDIFGYTKDIPEFIHRNGKLVADHIGILAGQVEDFVKAHPKEIAYAVGGFLISVALLIFFGPTVLLALGFGILGPVAGGLAATLQSIAMGGSAVVVLNLQVFAVLSVIVGLGLILYFTLHG